MLRSLVLNGTWDLRDETLTRELDAAIEIGGREDGWIPTPVPGDIHQGLIAAGRIREPLVGLNSFDTRWTEDRSWWYRRKFVADSSWADADAVELQLDGLDSSAEIFLNGQHIGSHRNTFRPFVRDVGPYLQSGSNTLLIRLTTGVEGVSVADVDAPDGVRTLTEADRGRPERGDWRRSLVRKPQYSFGWDWGPRVATTAIAGDVRLVPVKLACIRHVHIRPDRQDAGGVIVRVTATVDQLHYYQTRNGLLSLSIADEYGHRYERSIPVLLCSGLNFVTLEVPIADPVYWWPNGLGRQDMYQVELELDVEGQRVSRWESDYGLRFVELDVRGDFAFVINGKKVYCRGANWIPADALYARVDEVAYDTLVREARDANFNMLRIWGGGWYERDAFYKACDRYGIMVWHDFMFACSPYPDHLDSFQVEVEREADYQTKRLRNHACVVLWCGNNENTWGFRDWWNEQTRRGAHIYNYILPAVVQRNCPEIPYWNSSPYGGDDPNSNDVGDRHHWNDCMMNPDMNKRITPEEYDRCESLFVSEFGYVGACGKESTLEYLDGVPFDPAGQTWQHHTNTFEKDTVAAGILKHYGVDVARTDSVTLDEYLLYSGLCQGLMLQYALESMRYRENCHGSLFWMFNDCWGEVGWTVIDYYLRRKPSWYFVRRAFAPVRLIMREGDDGIRVVLANDTQENAELELEYGYVSLDGKSEDLARVRVMGDPLRRTELVVFERAEADARQGLWIARDIGGAALEPAVFRAVDYARLEVVDPALKVKVVRAEDHAATVAVSAVGYAHAVQIVRSPDVWASDDFFDLLPGESREVTIRAERALDLRELSVTSVNATIDCAISVSKGI